MSIVYTYLGPVQSAVMVFPLLALALTFPYILFEYRRYGAIPLLRTFLVYCFILYLINAYFQVILPLPTRAEVASSAAPAMQLEPGNFLRMIRRTADLDISGRRELIAFLKNPFVYQAILNAVLLFPLGVYLHYYYRRGLILSALIVFAVSLFFEFTQYSGLYGYYAHAYRTFDVDDLILNTAGGIAGWILSPVICFVLPKREAIDEAAYARGERVPFFRRFLAFLIDFSLVYVVSWVIALLIPDGAAGQVIELLISIALLTAYLTYMPYMTGGYTVGKWLFRLRLVPEGRGRWADASLLRYLIRALFISVLLAHIPFYYLLCEQMKQITYNTVFGFWSGFESLLYVVSFALIVDVLARMMMDKKVFLYEKISGLHNESRIERKQKK